MIVTIVGPNLPDQSKGTFHVHAILCMDLDKYPGVNLGRDSVDVASRREAAEYVYPLGDFEWDDDYYIDDLWFAPCCADLPRER
jgi:hypothetical protein